MFRTCYLFIFFLTTLIVPSSSFSETALPPLPPSLEKELQLEESKGNPGFSDKFLRMLSVLALTILILYVGLWILKRMIKVKSEKTLIVEGLENIRVLEKRALSLKTTLYVVEALGSKWIIIESIHGVSMMPQAPQKKEV